ncbi:fMet-Leu-Phe receptor [Esox lucius]|nr:fMet-Leu-Phe receptor [Esox lucius]
MDFVSSTRRTMTLSTPNQTGPIHKLGCNKTWQEEIGRVIQLLVTIVIFLVGVFLNGLVVWALALRGRGRLTRRGSAGEGETRGASSFRVYVVNLALADLVLLLRTPLMMAYLADNCSWPLGLEACKLVVFLRGLGLYAAAFLLCAVALERCLCLLRPVWASLKRPRWAVPLVCGLLWVLASALAAPYVYSALVKGVNGTKQCLDSDGYSQGLFVTETVAGFLLPLTVFLGSNLAVLWTARTATSSSSTQRMVRLYRVLFLTMLLFLTCWVPYFTCRFLQALAEGRPDWSGHKIHLFTAKYVSSFLVYLKSALNPVLYVFAARGLGRTIWATLPSNIGKVFNEESTDTRSRRTLKRGDSQI